MIITIQFFLLSLHLKQKQTGTLLEYINNCLFIYTTVPEWCF